MPILTLVKYQKIMYAQHVYLRISVLTLEITFYED